MKDYLKICLLFSLASCVKDANYTLNNGLSAGSILQFTTITPLSTPADSTSAITVRVAIDPNVDSAQNITLTTTAGSINGMGHTVTVATNLYRYVDFILTPGQVPGPVRLRASVLSTFYQDTIIQFTKSYPDIVNLQTGTNLLASSATSLPVVLKLIDYTGFPSLNQVIVLSTLDSVGVSHGQLTATSTYSPGTPQNFTYTPAVGFTGNLYFIATVYKEDGTTIVSPTVDVFIL